MYVVTVLPALTVWVTVTSLLGHLTVDVSVSVEVTGLGDGTRDEQAAETVPGGQLQSWLGVGLHC